MTDQSEAKALPAIRDEKYYFADGNIVLLVGGVLFKVRIYINAILSTHTVFLFSVLQIHSSLLTQESETFKDMFTLPVAQRPSGEPTGSEEIVVEGSCDESPIAVPEAACSSFRSFLFMFYGRWAGLNLPKYVKL